MARFEIVLKRSVAKDLRHIPNKDVARILACIADLADHSRPPGARQEKHGLAIGTDHANMRRSMIVRLDDDAQTVEAQDRRHGLS